MLNLNLVQFLSVQVNVKVTHSQLPTLVIGYMARASRSLWDIFEALRVRCEYTHCYKNKWAHNYASTQSQYTTLHSYSTECGLVHLI